MKYRNSKNFLTDSQKVKDDRIVNHIRVITGKYFEVEKNYFESKNRRRELVVARQVAMYLMSSFTRLGLAQIASVFNKDHATVVHAKKQVNALMKFDKSFKAQVKELETIVKTNISAMRQQNDLNNEYYFIDFNNHHSIKIAGNRGIIISGFTDREVESFKEMIKGVIDSRKHTDTGLHILEEKSKEEK